MSLDWTRPIVFANGQPCELIHTAPEGVTNFLPQKLTRVIRRIGVEPIAAATWFMSEDGKSNWADEEGYYVVNQPSPA